MSDEDIGHAVTRAEVSKDRIHTDAGVPDDGASIADFGVDLDSFGHWGVGRWSILGRAARKELTMG